MNGESWNDDNYSLEKLPQIEQLQLPLDLSASILQNIFRFLTSRKDRYETTLVHPKWTYAAQTVLWEDVSFDRPSMLHIFRETILHNNKLASYVKSIQFTIKDHLPHPHSTQLFQPVAKSYLARHADGGSILTSRMDVLLQIVKACENVSSLVLYGWRLKSSHLETLATIAKNLSSLTVIGADSDPNSINNLPPPLHFNSIAPRLRTLKLDGNFKLNEAWAKVLVQRATFLEELQLSVQSMANQTTLLTICSPHKLQLTRLTLTDAVVLYDDIIPNIFKAFPRLTHFCVEGLKQTYAMFTIAYAIYNCPQLKSLEIRASIVEHQQPSPSSSSNLMEVLQSLKEQIAHESWASSSAASMTANIHRLVLENIPVTDREFKVIYPYLSQLQTLGLKNCRYITDSALEGLIHSSTTPLTHGLRLLRTLHLIKCPLITSATLVSLANTGPIYQVLQSVYIDQCGELLPKDIFKLCVSCADYNLRHLTLINYPNLNSTVVGSFNNFNLNTSTMVPLQQQPHIIYMNRQAIDGLANTNDASVKAFPEPHIIEGYAFPLLAKHLRMDMDELVELLQRVKQEAADCQDNMRHQRNVITKTPDKARKHADRLQQLKLEANFSLHHQRPTTPALWSDDSKLNEPVTARSTVEVPIQEPDYDDYDNDNLSENNQYQYFEYDEEHQENSYAEAEHPYYDGDDGTAYDKGAAYERNEEVLDDADGNDAFDNYHHDQDDEDEDNDKNFVDSITTSPVTETKTFRRGHRHGHDPTMINHLPNTLSDQANLGSWGAPTTSINWASTVAETTTATSLINDTSKNVINPEEPLALKDIQSQQQYDSAAWSAYKEDDYREKWKQDPLIADSISNAQESPSNRFTFAHHRNSPNVMQANGWGNVKGFTPWDQTEGFVKEVIDEQSRTEYWSMENGKWNKLSTTTSSWPAATAAATGEKPNATEEFPLLSDVIDNELHKKPARKNSAKPTIAKRATGTPTRQRTSSVVSSDHSVNWEDDSRDDIVLKTYHTNNKNSTALPQTKQSNFAAAAASQKTNAIGINSASAVRSWQEHFKTEDIESKAAKDTWSVYTNNSLNDTTIKPTFARSAHSPTHSKCSRASTPSNSPNTITGPQNYTSATDDTRNRPQPSTDILIDADYTPSITTLNFDLSSSLNDQSTTIPEGNAWESLSNLNMSSDPTHNIPAPPSEATKAIDIFSVNTDGLKPQKDNLLSFLSDDEPPRNTTARGSNLFEDLASPLSSNTSTPIITNAVVNKQSPSQQHYPDLLSMDRNYGTTSTTSVNAVLPSQKETCSTMSILSPTQAHEAVPALTAEQNTRSSGPAKLDAEQQHQQQQQQQRSATADEPTTKQRKRPIKLKIQVPSDTSDMLIVPLEIQEDDDYEKVVKEFCDRYKLSETTFEHIRDQAKDRLTARKTKKVFSNYAKNRKTKKSPQTSP